MMDIDMYVINEKYAEKNVIFGRVIKFFDKLSFKQYILSSNKTSLGAIHVHSPSVIHLVVSVSRCHVR